MNTILLSKLLGLSFAVPSLIMLVFDLEAWGQFGLGGLVIAVLLWMMHGFIKRSQENEQKNQETTFEMQAKFMQSLADSQDKLSETIALLAASQTEHNLTSKSNFQKLDQKLSEIEKKIERTTK